MAGAGPNVERLSSVVVHPMLSEGGRFLKWDDVGELYFLPLLVPKENRIEYLPNIFVFQHICL